MTILFDLGALEIALPLVVHYYSKRQELHIAIKPQPQGVRSVIKPLPA